MSNWLGSFYISENGWVYHLELGWLFPVPLDDGSIWAWSPKLDWLWLSAPTFGQSLAWSHNDANWIFISVSNSTKRIFHYNNNIWTDFDPNGEISLENLFSKAKPLGFSTFQSIFQGRLVGISNTATTR